MSISKINLVLVLLVNIAAFILFINYVKVREDIAFDSKRIDELEKRPLLTSAQDVFPQAGESGKPIAVTAVPTSVSSISAILKTPTPSPTQTPTAAPAITGSRITYLPLFGGGGQTTDTNWVDVVGSDFQLKASDYGSSSYFTWEAVAFLIGGSGEARLQLFDTTNHVAVAGSQISVSAAARPTLVSSGRLSFFNGNNTYRVQISSLTSSTAQFEFGRVKVVY